jgi:cyclophilin family peptidyl-prolyl cis-trans isomerase/HEAT repeat protein
MVRAGIAGLALMVAAGAMRCVPVPTPPPVVTPAAPPPPPVPLDRKVAWLLRLEQQRVLREPAIPEPAAPAPPDLVTAASRHLVLAAATTPDLVALAADPDARVRRRAVLALGRVGLPEGAATLVSSLNDEDDQVRATAAFGLGLLGMKDAVAALQAALKDSSANVRGRAAEALGLVGEASAAGAVADAAVGCGTVIATLESDDEEWPKSPEIEACRLSLFALARLKQYDALARVALDERGGPVSRWWPVAYALQRIRDPRAGSALLALTASAGIDTPAFAIRGLGEVKDARVVPVARALAGRPDADLKLRVAAVRALGQVGGAGAIDALLGVAAAPAAPRTLVLEAVTAIGVLGDRRAFDALLDLWTDPWPAMRAAAIAAAAKVNPDGFLLVVSSLDPDKDWSVRAALASVFGTLPADRVRTAIEDLANDQDSRVRAPALEALARIAAPDLAPRLFSALDAPDFTVRATAARLVGEARPPGGAAKLVSAYHRGESDATYSARAAALEALQKYGGEEARATLRAALSDKDWPIRLRAAEWLRGLGETGAAAARPAPTRQSADEFESAALLHPSFSPHAFLETRRGTIEIELNVVDAPLTTRTFVELARAGFFTGLKVHRLVPGFVIQAGDPRGDGEGGPGYTIRDELSTLPYLRGTVGMALDGRDTGGSQFFITLSPQPHLDGKYTVFGQVVRGQEILDSVTQWDVIERVRIWDGVSFE